MKDLIATSLRHAFTALAGLGTFLFAHGLIGQGDAPAVDAAGASLGDVLAVIAAALVARLMVWVSGKVRTGGAPCLALWLCIGSLVVGGLPGCSGVPVRVGISGPDGAVSYSSKGGLAVDYRASK